ncbi:MAG: FAD-dependent oxidoreductase [Anaerolineales bacterium]|nr:FAD-dependent oxidoreductase [Anaerolineales bacterium]
MAGATAANHLGCAGSCQVTVFEAGIGIGGRMYTRMTNRRREDTAKVHAG